MQLIVTKEVADERRAACLECPKLITQFKAYKCEECGCFLKPKTRMKGGTCPLGKW